MRSLWSPLLALILVGSSASQGFDEPAWTYDLPFASARSPILADLNGDLRQDVVIAGLDGDLIALDVADRRVIWTQHLSATPLDFAAAVLSEDDSFDLVIPTVENTLEWIDGSTGTLLGSHPIPDGAAVAPTIWDLDGDGIDEILLISRQPPTLQVLEPGDEEGVLTTRWVVPLRANVGVAPSIGDVFGDGGFEVVVQNQVGGVAVLSSEGQTLGEWSTHSTFETAITVGDAINMSPGDEILFANLRGQLVTLSWVGHEAGDPLESTLSMVAERDTRFDHVALIGLPSPIILISTPRSIRALDGLTKAIAWDQPHTRTPATPLTMVPLEDGGTAIAYVDLDDRLHVSHFDGHVASQVIFTGVGGRSQFAPLAADFDGDRSVDFLLLAGSSDDLGLQIWGTGLGCEAGAALWTTAHGFPFNAGHSTSEQADHLRGQITAFNERVTRMAIQAQTALGQDDIEQSRLLAQRVLRWDNWHPRAREVYEQIPDPELRRQVMIYGSVGGLLVLLLTVGAIGYVKRRRKQRGIDSARQEQRWEDLLGLTGNLRKKRPRDEDLLVLRGEAFAALGKHSEESLPALRALAKRRPTTENKWALAQALLHQGGDDEEAIALFRELSRSGHDEPELHAALGHALLKSGDAARAVGHLQVVLRQEPDNTGVGMLLCEAQMSTGRLDDLFLEQAMRLTRLGHTTPALARALCQAAVKHGAASSPEAQSASQAVVSEGSDTAWAWICKGLHALEREDWSEIASAATQIDANAEVEGFDVPLRALAAIESDTPEAEPLLRQLVSGGHNLTDAAILRIAQSLAQRGRRDEMMRHFGERATLLPSCPLDVLECLAQTLAASGHRDEEVHVLARLAERDPNNAQRWKNHAQLCAELHRTDEQAVASYQRMLADPPETQEECRTLVFACASADLSDQRVADLASALLEGNPDDVELAVLLVDLLLRQGAAAEAHLRGKDLVERIPQDNLQALETLGRAAFEAKDYGQARDVYARLRESHPEQAVWARSLAICLSRLGVQDDDAIALHREVVAAHPNDPVMATILARTLLERGESEEGSEVVRETLRQHTDLAPQMVRLLTKLVDSLTPERAGPIRLLLADLLSEQGEFSEAAQHLNEILGTEAERTGPIAEKIERLAGARPDNVDALMALALVSLRRGEHRRAMEEVERARKLDPDNRELRELHVNCMRHLTSQEDNAENRLRLGELMLDSELPDEALSVLQPIQDDVFLFRPVRLAITRAYIQKRLLDVAWKELQTVPTDEASKPVYYLLGERAVEEGSFSLAKQPWEKLYRHDIKYRDIRSRHEQLLSEKHEDEEQTRVMPAPAEPTLSTAGEQLFRERFELEEEVGVGGMGRVYRAHDKVLDEIVALKILPPQLASNEQIVDRLKREVRAARQLTHQHIIRIHDFGALGGHRFISMEFVQGPTLKHLIRTPPGLDPVQKLTYAIQIAEALAHAHRKGIVHRDIKPANILIDDKEDSVIVTDFGIAKVIGAGLADATSTNQVLGTPLYMSPEQVRGDRVDGRADIYSFGITLHEMLSGAPPFTEGDLAYQHLTKVPERLTEVSERLSSLVAKCLEKEPDKRPQSFEEILTALGEMDESDTVLP